MNCKTMLLALTLALPLGVSAKADKKKAKTEVAKPDTVPNNIFSYSYGMTNTMGLKNYLASRMDVDTTFMADFMQGFSVTEQSIADQRLKAYLKGIEIRRQIERDVFKNINSKLSGNDTTTVIDHDSFIEGFCAALAGKPTIMPMDSASAIVQKQNKWYETRNMMAKYGDWKAECEAFMQKNAKADSVQTTASGLQYKVLRRGEGGIPTADQRVKVHYEGKLIDGTVFDSSYSRNQPATFGCSQVIKGWTEALTMMPVGSKWMLYIPQELAYGTRETGKIKPFSALIFTVELLEVVK